MTSIKVWDGFIRGFHWLLVAGLAVLYVSGEEGWLELHFVTGYLLLALFVTRLIWGVVGSETAKLSSLVSSPKAVIESLKGNESRLGHNAAGGYMVLLFFVLIGLQLVTGLFTTDDILVDGPLVSSVSYDVVEIASQIHRSNIDWILLAVLVHMSAIVLYKLRGKALLGTLLTGKKDTQLNQPIMRSGKVAYVIFCVLAGLLLYLWGQEPLAYLFG